MHLRDIFQLARNNGDAMGLWTQQDALEEAYSRVGGKLDPVRHREELTRLEAICAVLKETSQMPNSRACKQALRALMIAHRQMRTAASFGLVGVNIALGDDDVVWLSPSDMTGTIGSAPDTHVIGSIVGWIRLAAFFRMHRKGLLRDAKMDTVFSWTKAYRSDAIEEVSLQSISREFIDDSSGLPAGGNRQSTVSNLKYSGRLLRDIDATVRTQTADDFSDWADEVQNGAELVRWIHEQTVGALVTSETAVEAARIALEVLITRFKGGSLGMVHPNDKGDVRFVEAEPLFGIAVPAGAQWIGCFDTWSRLAEVVVLQLRRGNDGETIRNALLSDAGGNLLKKQRPDSWLLRDRPPQLWVDHYVPA